MGFDMVVALPGTTLDRQTLFGHNGSRPTNEGQALHRQPAQDHAHGQALVFGPLALPQVRHTHAVIGWQSAGQWGFRDGVNEQGVAIGCNPIRTRLAIATPGLSGPDLVRLALERAGNARQARDLILDLVTRHGQGWLAGAEAEDSSFLVADGKEAFALETAGSHWAEQEIQTVRAVSDTCQLHQDWNRISRGLAELAIGRGWCPEDGSKLDFAEVVAPNQREAASLRRWGRATLLLEQQSGRLDPVLFRRLLSDHFENPTNAAVNADAEQSICQHGVEGVQATTASLIVELSSTSGRLPVAWWAFGPPCASAYFPILLVGELPAALQAQDSETGSAVCQSIARLLRQARQDQQLGKKLHEEFALLQTRFDDNCHDLRADAAQLLGTGDRHELERLTASFMQHNVESFNEVCERLSPSVGRTTMRMSAAVRPVAQEMSMSAF